MAEKTIRFTSTQVVKFNDQPGKADLVYEEGKEYTLREDRANRWLRRGVAVDVAAKSKHEPVVGRVVKTETETRPLAPKAEERPPVDFQASQGSTEILGKKEGDGDNVASSAAVSGANGSGAGVGNQSHSGRGRGGARGGSAGGSNQ